MFAQEIRQELEERGLAAEQLGIVGFDDVARGALKEAGLNLVEGWPLLLEASKTKTVDEINCLKMAASICTSGWQQLVDTLRPGMTVGRAANIVQSALGQAGSERPIAGVHSGPMSFERNMSGVNRRLEHGDLLYVPL